MPVKRSVQESPDARRPAGHDVFGTPDWRALDQSLGLSQRESQIVRGVFDDLKELAIAAQLGMSPHTVHTHLERLYHKLGVNSRTELIVRIVAEHEALTRDAPPQEAN